MSFVTAQPTALTAAAGVLQSIGVSTVASNTAAAPVTTAVLPPAADEVSAFLSQFFSTHAQEYHGHAARGAVVHQKLVQSLLTGSFAYATTELATQVGF
ncbi:PE family protein [Mycobacterium haemophilum]|uniref:PE domain-containing protein n=1 Tax=Mycobacterium haemophilum TaxID=29311 RepID=A0A0I9TEU6_9MYCO|nr:PE family protein [Mycobacterium haemophilum]AKN16578.1 hypothetical protein B586_08440 [Mycobacterium haemophilum DSM 44634]KLO28159.1 hypothetical protein ABH39_14415 [Mycobacterium haemophilum]KLO37622.1 hypothetical protein ABH38_06435 [Mycobacterium haemophilum]KLO43296.1 hypothetical protein ABH37_08645 [Mycobacterium haemophilum]KLO48038.1 hypothetical protein ABH36_14955 [Mycobacterium haemophilum]